MCWRPLFGCVACLVVVALCGCGGGQERDPATPRSALGGTIKSAASGASSQELTGVAHGWWENPRAHCPAGTTFQGSYPGKSDDPADWVAECFHQEDAVRGGPFTAWWPNGEKQEEGAFKDDDAVGVWAEWSDKGALISTRVYEGGELTKVVRYDENGKPLSGTDEPQP